MPFLLFGCSTDAPSMAPSNGGAATGGSAITDAGSSDADAAADATPTGSLTVSLDPSLDQPDDDVKAHVLTNAILLDDEGVAVATAIVLDGRALFNLVGVASGIYFIQVNGDSGDLVPTRIDDPRSHVAQRIGECPMGC